MTRTNTFQLTHQEGYARAGILKLPHGEVHTPVFMPVGTYGAVKTLCSLDLKQLETQILLGNTYHLALRPGLEELKTLGGLHKFMNWGGPILTDSGGFQVFSLSKLGKISEEGVKFQSPLDGRWLFFTPEFSALAQQHIGSDIAMIFDQCVALPAERPVIKEAMERTLRWTERFLQVPRQEGQHLFGIVQGGLDFDLRKESLERTLDFDDLSGLAIGGLSVGEPQSAMLEILDFLAPSMPREKPHYLMGVGTPLDILEAIHLGIDMFDCVLPTRNARNGAVFTDRGLLNLKNAQYARQEAPVDSTCGCECCKNHSLAYLHHLIKIKEILGCRLATIHNLYYYRRFVREIREAIKSGTFSNFYQEKRALLKQSYPDKRKWPGAEGEL